MRKLARGVMANARVIGIAQDGLLFKQLLIKSTQEKALIYLLAEYGKFTQALENAERMVKHDLKKQANTGLVDEKKLLVRHGVPKILLDYY